MLYYILKDMKPKGKMYGMYNYEMNKIRYFLIRKCER